MALPFTSKTYLKAKEELWKFKYFNTLKYNLQEKSLKNLSRYHNSITNLKFQHKPKISSFKNPQMKMDLLPGGQIHLRYYTLQWIYTQYPCLARQGHKAWCIKDMGLRMVVVTSVGQFWKAKWDLDWNLPFYLCLSENRLITKKYENHLVY